MQNVVRQRYVVLGSVVLSWWIFGPQALAGDAKPGAAATESLVAETEQARLVVGSDGRVNAFFLRTGENLLDRPGTPLMALQIGGEWHEANSLLVSPLGEKRMLRVGFAGTSVTACAMLRCHPRYFEIATVSLEGPGRKAVEQWTLVHIAAKPRHNVGDWLNVTWDRVASLAVIALEERTNAYGSPDLRAVAHRCLELEGRKAAILACPTSQFLDTVQAIEKEHGLPAPTLARSGPRPRARPVNRG